MLILLSLLVIAVRYCTEFYLFNSQYIADFDNASLKVSGIIFLLTLSDFLPICSQIAVIWISSRSNWNKLIQDYLRPFNENDLNLTLSRPMLQDIKCHDFQSELLRSSVLSTQKHELFTETVTIEQDLDSALSTAQFSDTNSVALMSRNARLSETMRYRDKRRS